MLWRGTDQCGSSPPLQQERAFTASFGKMEFAESLTFKKGQILTTADGVEVFSSRDSSEL